MSNFRSAIQTGIELANEAREKKREIQSVFDELAREVSEEFDNHVNLKLKQKFESADKNPFQIAASIQGMFGAKGRHYTAIIAFNPEAMDTAETEIAEWNVHENGYPVLIEYAGRSVSSDNKDELIEALINFLSNTSTGEKIKKVSEAE